MENKKNPENNECTVNPETAVVDETVSEKTETPAVKEEEQMISREDRVPEEERDLVNSAEDTAPDPRRELLWGIGGAYLCYIGFQLCAGVFKGAEGANPLFVLVGLGFIGFGGYLVVRILLSRKDRQKAENDQKPSSTGTEGRPGIFGSSVRSQPAKKMSIAQRARLGSGETGQEMDKEAPDPMAADKAEPESESEAAEG